MNTTEARHSSSGDNQPHRRLAQKALARQFGLIASRSGRWWMHSRMSYSATTTPAIRRIWQEFGQARVLHPERLAITLDHAVPAPTTKHAQNHAEIREFVREQGIAHFFEVGRGICHQVLSEEAIVLPGQLILGADSHTTHYGWMGAFGAGIGRSEVAALWATGQLWLRVPETMRIELDGELPPWVTAKDFALRVIGDLGADGGLYAMIEFGGSGIEALPLEARMILPNMMAEFGAKSAFIAPNAAVVEYVAARLGRRRSRAEAAQRGERRPQDAPAQMVDEARAEIEALLLDSDDGAPMPRCIATPRDIEPTVACPHTVDNVRLLSEVSDVRVQQAFLGTCTNGRLSDLAVAAQIVQGRRTASGTRFLVIPASAEVLQDALRLGYIQTLVEAGAVIGVPGCGPCMGNHMGIPAPGETTISSANRNFRGRMGTPDSYVYLASPAVVAASAIMGRIADPRELE